MTEFQTDCEIIGRIPDVGDTLQFDLKLIRGGREYYLSVARQSYIESLREANKILPTEDQYPDNLYPLPNLEDVCQQLSQIPDDQLQPYWELVEPNQL